MVGVPGRSKGCTTCRRRKIRCDLDKPFCKRCSQSGRVCEGYQRYPVFINRTTEGFEKRHRLEEAKTLPYSNDTGSETHLTGPEVTSFHEVLFNRRASDNRLLTPPSSSTVFDQQIISSFWEKCIPSNAGPQDGPPNNWLQRVICLPKPGKAIFYSLKALAMTRLGWINRDESLALQGRLCYSSALQVLHTRLSSEHMIHEDDIFAAGFALSIYELFESTTPSIAGWNSHISGLGNLVRQRGPARHSSPLALSILVEYRYSTMIQCIQFRKSSFLGDWEWLTIPWGDAGKDVYQRLYDKGFAIGALLEDVDNNNLSNIKTRSSQLSSYLQRCSALHTDFECWYQQLLQQSPSPLYSTTKSNVQSGSTVELPSNDAPNPENLSPFTFPSVHLAYIITTYWALKLILSSEIALTCRAILADESATQSIHADPDLTVNLTNTAHRLLSQHGSAQCLELATNIMRSMAYSLNDSMGLLGAAKSLFPLRVALFALRRQPGEELRWCQAVYQELETKKGLRYAREIAKLDGKISPTGLTAPA